MTMQFKTLSTPHLRIIRKYDRPNVNILWWTTVIPEYVKEYYNLTYISQGKLSEEWAESEDGLSLYHNSLYHGVDPIDFENWVTDPVVSSWLAMRQEYCNSVGIIIHPADIYLVTDGVEVPIDAP